MASVRLEQVTRRYGNTTAIANISFEVPDGEFWVLVGPSGCGKSTLLRTIAGLETVSSGDIYLDDQPVTELPGRERDVAMVFQNYALYPHMTVAENLTFGLRMRRVNPATYQNQVQIIARSLGIEHLLKRKPGQLSGGQQQRVALGRAIIRQPRLFLLDEPLSNLDAQLRDETRTELKQLHAQVGITTLYVTHDQMEALTLSDRIVVLNQGKIAQIGTPREIYAHPKSVMVATFMGSPPMNILPVSICDRKLKLPTTEITLSESDWFRWAPFKGHQVLMGIRPEAVRISSNSEDDLAKVKVTTVEPLGRETLIRAVLGDQLISLYAPPQSSTAVGEMLPIEWKFTETYLFDTQTEQCLLSTAN
ncbi:MAG: ABC transporter ATP-binding protein [Cyanobacteria bacterium P01_H01_bin.15]